MKITGNRRSFVCRILYNTHRNHPHGFAGDHEYQVVQFTGYIKYEPYLLNLVESNSESGKEAYDNSLGKGGRIGSRNDLSDTASTTSSLSNSNLMLDKDKYFLILYGQLANKKVLQQYEFIMKSEFDSKIIYVDPQ